MVRNHVRTNILVGIAGARPVHAFHHFPAVLLKGFGRGTGRCVSRVAHARMIRRHGSGRLRVGVNTMGGRAMPLQTPTVQHKLALSIFEACKVF